MVIDGEADFESIFSVEDTIPLHRDRRSGRYPSVKQAGFVGNSHIGLKRSRYHLPCARIIADGLAKAFRSDRKKNLRGVHSGGPVQGLIGAPTKDVIGDVV